MEFRFAIEDDVPEIVRLLADDELGLTRERYESPLPEVYIQAFREIQAQAGNSILLALEDAQIIGCLQLTIIPGLGWQGRKSAQIEGVRIDSRYRSKGYGEAMIQHTAQIARAQGCTVLQLTTVHIRTDAQRFYTRNGFVATHVGMKMEL
ncbi:ribosomal protein S18 acetylase RimI-like enzyme [Paenibacillus shirakamiensis]|uniref:Ribosomal protein S18 acetylase RimI-like enzyme n=1 Tax=Paenibacillus shirakamiensis TaxID=1265935 RepID=A0ABS4JGT3_9BACL|nr:GNAT family N-acetyltransferase [Paenibacillus shirakamiensis]MBP2000931.1 ribosomal protein S18 acetylase RimI-like enzyme [Paenibacillus shirakamiensis]